MSLGKQEKQKIDKWTSHLRSLGRHQRPVPKFACAFCERPMTSKREVKQGYCDTCIKYLRNNLNNVLPKEIKKVRENQFVFR